MTTCLINDQINDKRKMSILSEDTLLESGKLFKKNFQSRSSDTCAASSTQCPNFQGLFTSKVTWYYTWSLKPKRWIANQRLFFLMTNLTHNIIIYYHEIPCLGITHFVKIKKKATKKHYYQSTLLKQDDFIRGKISTCKFQDDARRKLKWNH